MPITRRSFKRIRPLKLAGTTAVNLKRRRKNVVKIEENSWIGYNPIYTQIIYVKPLLFISNISTHSFQFDNLCLKLQ